MFRDVDVLRMCHYVRIIKHARTCVRTHTHEQTDARLHTHMAPIIKDVLFGRYTSMLELSNYFRCSISDLSSQTMSIVTLNNSLSLSSYWPNDNNNPIISVNVYRTFLQKWLSVDKGSRTCRTPSRQRMGWIVHDIMNKKHGLWSCWRSLRDRVCFIYGPGNNQMI